MGLRNEGILLQGALFCGPPPQMLRKIQRPLFPNFRGLGRDSARTATRSQLEPQHLFYRHLGSHGLSHWGHPWGGGWGREGRRR